VTLVFSKRSLERFFAWYGRGNACRSSCVDSGFMTPRVVRKTWLLVPLDSEKDYCTGEDQWHFNRRHCRRRCRHRQRLRKWLSWVNVSVCVCVCVFARGGEDPLISECPLESPPVEGDWPVATKPLLLLKNGTHFKAHKCSWKSKNRVMGPDDTRNQDLPCWKWPAANLPTDGDSDTQRTIWSH
jgi:hypothetical protein